MLEFEVDKFKVSALDGGVDHYGNADPFYPNFPDPVSGGSWPMAALG
jgi:hypothetical protein